MLYIGNTFSPMMLADGKFAGCGETTLEQALEVIESEFKGEFTSVVSHELTAPVISNILGCEVKFNRVNLKMKTGDVMICVIPNFRATEAREFTKEEIVSAGFKIYMICVI